MAGQTGIGAKVAIGGGGLVAFGVLAYFLFFREVPVRIKAEQVLEDMLEADGEALMDVAFEDEVTFNNLNYHKLGRIYRELVLPRLAVCQVSSKTASMENGYLGTASRKVTAPNGFETQFEVFVYSPGDRMRSSVLLPLFTVWYIEFFDSPEGREHPSMNLAIYRGLKKDEWLLKEVGLTHISMLDTRTGLLRMVSIDDMLTAYSHSAEQHR